MCDHCSDFQQLLFTVERNYASALEASETADRSDSELQPVLSAADVGVALQFLNVWHHKQCMCVFREVWVGELTVSMLYAFDWSTKSLFCICIHQQTYIMISGMAQYNYTKPQI